MNLRVALLGLGFGALALGVAVGDQSCQVMPATVTGKRESIEELISPHWRPLHEVEVAFAPLAEVALRPPWQADRQFDTLVLPTDTATYDRLRPGATVSVRYFPPWPEIARLDQQSLLAAVFQPLSLDPRESGILFVVALLIWIVLALARGWWPRPFGSGRRQLLLIVINLVMLQALPLGFLGIREWLPVPAGPQLSTSATVEQTRLISRIGGTRFSGSGRSSPIDLPAPFERVLVSFVPAGWDQPVVAVDEVTPGRVPGLDSGATVRVVYAAAQPRVAWIENASRDHRIVNRLFLHGLVTVPFLLVLFLGWVLGLALGTRRVGRHRRRV